MRLSPVAALIVSCSLALTQVAAETVIHNYIGGVDGDPLATQTRWATSTNWDTGVVPNSPTALVQFGAFSQAVIDSGLTFDRLNLDSTSASGRVITFGAIAFQPDLVVQGASQFLVRNVWTGTTSFTTLELHGIPRTINDQEVTLLIGNFGAQVPVLFSTANISFQLRLHNSGVIHTTSENLTNIAIAIVDDGSNRSVTKTGSGTLQLGAQGVNSTFGGGFTLAEGIVEWTNSGTQAANPFGLGALTLQGGTIRSTSHTSARTIITSVALDGGAAFGWNGDTNNASITVSAGDGTLATTMLADSTLTVHNTTTWSQGISGDYRLTKEGDGRLTLSGNNSFQALTVRGGGDVTISSTDAFPALPPSAGGVMGDHIVLDGGTLRFSGIGTTLSSRRGITLTPQGGTLEVTGTWLMGSNAPIVDADPLNPGGLVKTGTGNFTMTELSAPTYAGPTTIAGGTIYMDSALPNSAVEVLAGARLGGAGSFGGDITVRGGGEFRIGSRLAVGTTEALSPVLLEADALLSYRIGGDLGSDMLRIHDTLSLDGAFLQLTLLGQPSPHDVFVLVDNRAGAGSILGSLSIGGQTLGEGAIIAVTTGDFSQEFTIHYDYSGGGFANSLALVAVPEPAGWAALCGIAVLCFSAYRRRKT